jgi:hypothetical protein
MTQEARNKRLIISLLALLVATVLVSFLLREENTLEVDKDVFHVTDLKQIDQISLSSRRSAISLSYNGARWKVNSDYDADRNMIDVLFATLQQAVPKRPITGSRGDSIAASIKNEGVKVQLLKSGSIAKTFYAGGNLSKTQAYFVDEASGDVYSMTIPGYRVYVSGVFELDESGWRDKYVFGFNWRNFQGLSIVFPQRPKENFTVLRMDNFFGIEGLVQTDTSRLNTFLDQVSTLMADRFSSDQHVRDSLLKTDPAMVITVRDIGKREFLLKLYPQPEGGEVAAVISDTQLAYFQRQKVISLFRPKSFFVPKQ